MTDEINLLEDFGIVCILEDLVAAPIADGRLAACWETWCEPFAGYHHYYPDRRGDHCLRTVKNALRASRAFG